MDFDSSFENLVVENLVVENLAVENLAVENLVAESLAVEKDSETEADRNFGIEKVDIVIDLPVGFDSKNFDNLDFDF